MSYSPNSEMTHSRRLETKTFEKYGMTFRYGVTTEIQPEWERVVQEQNGQEVLEWQLTGKTTENTYVSFAMIKDATDCESGKHIGVYATSDGPIMGIELERDAQQITLLDPCVVQFDSKSARLNFMPIFNVARRLTLLTSAVRSIQVPAELLIGAYPGFLISNRMAKYQLKTQVPLATTTEIINEAS